MFIILLFVLFVFISYVYCLVPFIVTVLRYASSVIGHLVVDSER
jgi:hypothetical protein